MIRAKANKCFTAFQSCTDALNLDTTLDSMLAVRPRSPIDQDARTLLKAQTGRFRLWAANISAGSDKRASLDYRLRDAPDVAEMVGHLLDIVSIRLAHIENPRLEFPADHIDEHSSSFLNTGHENNNFLEQQQDSAIKALVEDIGRLQRLSLAIRRAGGKYAMSRLNEFKMWDEDTLTNPPKHESTTMKFEVDFLKFVQEVLLRRFPRLNPDLRQHLASMIDFRRKRLLYAQSHQVKLAAMQDEKPEPVHSTQHSMAILEDAKPIETVPMAKALEPRETSTIASTFDHHQFIKRRKQAPPSVASSQLSIPPHVRDHPDLPGPPRLQDQELEHPCPYCGWSLPRQDYSEKRWKRHVLHDLEPYICLDKACFHTQTAFARSQDWVNHTYEEHIQSWKCPCHEKAHGLDVEVFEPQRFIFASRGHLDQHLAEMHQDISSSKARTIARRSIIKDTSKVFQSCPFCDWLPETDPSNADTSTMADHTANHLVSLVSMALPARDDFPILEDAQEESVILNVASDQSSCSAFSIDTSRHGDQRWEEDPVEDWSEAGAQGILTLEHIQIGWVCALPIEALLAEIMLDELIDQTIPLPPNDNNIYSYGRIKINGSDASHIVAVAMLPLSTTGNASAATIANHMRQTFPNLKFGIMIGIADGIWTPRDDIRLGDVVVGVAYDGSPGVIQYDHGKAIQEGEFVPKSLNKAPTVLLSAVELLRRKHERGIADYVSSLQIAEVKQHASRPSVDNLFTKTYIHRGGDICEDCDKAHLIVRRERHGPWPRIHYGVIASSDEIIKDAVLAEKIQKTNNNIMCFEMEAAGLDAFPCLVIRGISDYADTHKSGFSWPAYASATAAAYAKELLAVVSLIAVAELPSIHHHPVRQQFSNPYVGKHSLSKVLKQLFGDAWDPRITLENGDIWTFTVPREVTREELQGAMPSRQPLP